MDRVACLVFAAMVAAAAGPAVAQSGLKMQMEAPADFAATRQAYTKNHDFLVKLVALPQPIPYEGYFDLRFAVYDGHHPTKQLTDADLTIEAGMRHGLTQGFAHGMQSSPKITKRNGEFTVSGMYFHMMGPWVLKMTVSDGGKQGVAYFRLPCCGK